MIFFWINSSLLDLKKGEILWVRGKYISLKSKTFILKNLKMGKFFIRFWIDNMKQLWKLFVIYCIIKSIIKIISFIELIFFITFIFFPKILLHFIYFKCLIVLQLIYKFILSKKKKKINQTQLMHLTNIILLSKDILIMFLQLTAFQGTSSVNFHYFHPVLRKVNY